MPDPQYRSGDHDHYHDSDQESYTVCSIASSNETTDDQPGAGRTLGMFYSFIGSSIERNLGALADRLGHSPDGTVSRIQKQRLIVASKGVPSNYGWKRKHQVIQELINDRNLDIDSIPPYFLRGLDYSRLLPSSKKKKDQSNVESTKKQALDYIVDLSISDEYIRELLLDKAAVNILNSFRRDPVLRNALLVLDDAELHTRARKLQRSHEDKGTSIDIQAACLRDLAVYLQDHKYSFVAIRYLRQLSWYTSIVLGDAVRKIAEALNANPDIVEFEECDRILEMWMKMVFGERDMINGFSAGLEIIFRYAEKLPRTVGSREFQKLLRDLETRAVDIVIEIIDCIYVHYMLAVLLKVIMDANRQGDGDLWGGRPCLQPLLHALESPPDIALSKFAYKNYPRLTQTITGAGGLRDVCNELTFYASSEDSHVQERAWYCARVLVATDIYCRASMLKALSLTSKIRHPSDFTTFVEKVKVKCPPMSGLFIYYRHCDAEGRLLHVLDIFDYDGRCDRHGCVMEHVMDMGPTWDDIIYLHLERGTAFSSAGYYPILAGHTVDGERAYLALAVLGTKPEDLRVQKRSAGVSAERTPISLDVLVLRWAPDLYEESEDININVGMDATGPFFWRLSEADPRC
ncbi:hypothetical protein EW145_g2577 [Phellinidium pouzarii]|uniref:Uncharacterized protein n=1 Tax=Phellinidium pouzarii TaxID=167371 RepID=A0A4S4LAQ4_9AGAM|nr:hypothetical protein EW145_g2577 [Phellinidium pouzarii]